VKLISYFLIGMITIAWACKSEPTSIVKYIELTGKTMGTTYSIKYLDSLNRDFKPQIDSLLIAVNNEVSTYEPESFISLVNKSEEAFQYVNLLKKKAKLPRHFKANFEKAKEVFKNSNGYFDPTVMPIVNYWGFGYTEKRPVEKIDTAKVDSLMNFVGFNKVTQRSAKDGWVYLIKDSPGVQLDFSAIAKGYGVDVVANLLHQKGLQNYFVEIGGELIAHGKNAKNNWWTIGINTPAEKAAVSDIQSKVTLQNKAMATSGNYRNFYEVNGVKYAHTLNPKTGFPEKNTLLSATVFAVDCMSADAYATACMAMGLEKAMTMIDKLDNMEAYFLFSDANGNVVSQSTSSNLKIINNFN
jgi:thiamine biosynthesis lipoprotein